MTARATPPFRADHVGSLLRPPALLRAREQHADGALSREALRAIEDTAIEEAVRLQRDVGLRAVTDGEFRRASWHMDFIYALDGIERTQEHNDVEFHNAGGTITFQPAAPAVTGRIGLTGTIFGEDLRALQAVAGDATAKLTIPSPSMVHYGSGRARIDPFIYPDLDAFWDDLADAYAEEIRRLGELGCTYLQLDDTSLAYFNDPSQREFIARMGGDPERQHERYIATINRALAGRPPGMAVTTHLCRGNYRSSWRAQGGYDYIAEALFGDLEVDGYFLEYDDERSGGFEPLRFVPKGKQVVLGLVTTKHADLESKDELKTRIELAARHLDVDQLCLSPQCGFSSTVEGNDLTIEEQTAKLRLVVEVAEEVWALRELVYFVAPSLDGRIASPAGDIAAFPPSGDHIDWTAREYPDTLPKVALDALGVSADGSRFDTALMGWGTYAAGLAVGVDDPYPHLRQIVFSRSPREVPDGIELVREDPVGQVRALKQETGTPIWLCGGGGLAGAVLGEIDRLVLKVNPVLLGAGVPMIDASYDPRDFGLVSRTTFDSGVVVGEYERRR